MENEILEDKEKVQGQIYIMVNTKTCKKYVGQTVTHRKNHSKYRPFGYIGRFKDHISEALCNTKTKQCRYLNNAIRMYGKEAFTVSLLHTCPLNELDSWETHYIQEENSLYPNGYNLTKGGKTFEQSKGDDIEMLTLQTPGVRGGCSFRSDETRKLISERLKDSCSKEEDREKKMIDAQHQHYQQKLERFRGCHIDLSKMSQYIRFQKYQDGMKIKIVIDKKSACFYGKHQTVEELEARAKEFIQQVATLATLSNCSGNP